MNQTQGSVTTMDSVDPEEFYRSSDMAMVSWLKTKGHDPQGLRWEADTCYWLFDKSDPLLEAVDDFHEDRAMVEVKKYNRAFNSTRKEFFDSNPTSRGGRRR